MINNSVATGTAASVVHGIRCTAGINTVTNNTIYNLFQNGQMTGGGTAITLAGISYTSTTAPAVVSGNTIHTLKLTHPTTLAAQQMVGIFYTGPTLAGSTNLIAKNFIHSFSIASVNDSAAFMTGLDLGSGLVTVKNNMMRLGIDDQGSAVATPCIVRGISENAATSNVYNNSIYIGGNSTGFSTKPTYAYQRSGTGGLDTVLNNIFVNNRSNATTGGKHYQAFITTSNLNLTMNYNNYFGNGVGSVFGFNGTADAGIYSAGWVSTDLNSISGDPIFLAPEDGVASIDMHIDAGTPTPVEQTGTFIASVTDDIDGQDRSLYTPNDIGADADNFNPLGGCSGTPLSGTAGLTSATPICGSGSRTMTLVGYVNQPGLTYQWQESATGTPGSFVDVTTGTNGNTIAYTTPVLTTSAYYQCVIKCSYSPLDSNLSSTLYVAVNPTASITASGSVGSVCAPGTPAILTASGANTYTWLPVAGLTPSTGSPVNASPAANTTYTVTGTDINGCTATATVSLTVNSGIAFTSVTATPASICAGATSTLAATLAAPASYCAVTNAGTACLTNVSIGTLNNTTVGCTGTSNYNFYPTPVTTLTAGATYTLSLTTNGTAITSVWIDYDQDGLLETTEWNQIYTTGLTGSIPITIPAGAANGQTRMRIRSRGAGNANAATDACIVMGGGETEDYTIEIVGGGSLSYAWTPAIDVVDPTASTTSTAPLAATTTFSVTATAANGCQANGAVTVTVDVLNVTTTATPATICLGGSSTLNSNATGGGLPYAYSWSDGSGVVSNSSTFSASPSVTTTYTLTVTDNCGGSTNSSVTVTVDSMQVPLATNSSQCGIGIPTASVATGGTGSGIYSWYTAATGGTLLQTGISTTYLSPISGTTNFYVSELGLSGCASLRTLVVATVTDEITVTPSSAVLCTGASPATLVASSINAGYTYTWAPATGLSATTGASVDANPAATTTYTVTGDDGAGCTNTKTVTVGVFVSPTAPVLTATPGTICEGGSTNLTATAPSAPPSRIYSFFYTICANDLCLTNCRPCR